MVFGHANICGRARWVTDCAKRGTVNRKTTEKHLFKQSLSPMCESHHGSKEEGRGADRFTRFPRLLSSTLARDYVTYNLHTHLCCASHYRRSFPCGWKHAGDGSLSRRSCRQNCHLAICAYPQCHRPPTPTRCPPCCTARICTTHAHALSIACSVSCL